MWTKWSERIKPVDFPRGELFLDSLKLLILRPLFHWTSAADKTYSSFLGVDFFIFFMNNNFIERNGQSPQYTREPNAQSKKLIKEDGFVDKVKAWWSSFSFRGSPSFILAKKLRALKGEIKRWNREVFGIVGARIKAWAEELELLDRSEEVCRLSEEEKERRSLLASDLEASLLQEKISWRQKSRVWWLKEGDKCTKFFHQVASANRKNNAIESLIVNGLPTSDPACIGEHVVNYYKTLFTEPLSWRPRLDNLEFDRLNGEEASSLEDPFEEREVIKGMDRDKVPGPDGFTMAFF
jgi:hypothetical protein